MLWFFLIVLSGWCGFAFRTWWTILLAPILAGALGAYSVATEGENYDMHGFGYHVAALVAVVCVIAWLLGRGIAALLDRLRAPDRPT
jgi:hypothetical protein